MISRTRLKSIVALMTSFLVMSVGHGLLNTLTGIRATEEQYSDFLIAGFTSGYYIGFIAGTYIAGRWIAKVGHIRTFAACATLASSLALGLVLLVSPASWLVIRTIYGMCVAGLYMVIESWLNGTSKNDERGKILSIYMLISYLGIVLGQGVIYVASTEGFALFAVCSILLSVCLVPLTVSNSVQPDLPAQGKLQPMKLFRISPLAVIGCFCSGLILGAFWGFGPVFLIRLGFSAGDAAFFVGATQLGGLLLQWPIGSLSDKFDRRAVICGTSLLAALSAIAIFFMLYAGTTGITIPFLVASILFGGSNYALYSLCIALINDFLPPADLVKASGGLLALHAVGAVAGPLAASGVMALGDAHGFMVYNCAISLCIMGVALFQLKKGRRIPEETSEAFVSLPRTGVGVLSLNPRGDERAET